MNLPLVRQIFVVTSTLLAAISTGGIIGVPSVLLQQFRRDDSLIKVDVDTESWIASIHGLAGTTGIIIPYLMQCWGRRFGFRISCLIVLIGWITLYFADRSLTVMIAETFQGIGTKGVFISSITCVSEMVDPKIRNRSLVSYGITQTIVVSFVHAAGSFIHWTTISIVMAIPVALSIAFSFIWPESPAWLAYKGKFDDSKKSFIWLRGKNKESLLEMNAIFSAQREFLQQQMSTKTFTSSKLLMKNVWRIINSRDFYIPTFHMFVLFTCYYWSGNLVIMIYAINLVDKVTGNSESAFIGMIIIDIALILGNISCPILLKYFNNKPIVLVSGTFAILCLLGSSSVSYLQQLNIVSEDSSLCLYFLVGFMLCSSIGLYIIPFAVSVEVMPLRHRGVGGALFIALMCVHYTTVLKTAPYLMIYLGMHGTFLLYAVIMSFCLTWIWLYVPETKNKTLQSIEEHYIKYSRDPNENLDEGSNETEIEKALFIGHTTTH